MEITIKYNGQAVSVSVEAPRDVSHPGQPQQRRTLTGTAAALGRRECDEYIIAPRAALPYCATPEELVCQRETLDEILAVLALCTHTQRERFCSMRCTISAMRRLPRCAVVPKPQSISALRPSAKSF